MQIRQEEPSQLNKSCLTKYNGQGRRGDLPPFFHISFTLSSRIKINALKFLGKNYVIYIGFSKFCSCQDI